MLAESGRAALKYNAGGSGHLCSQLRNLSIKAPNATLVSRGRLRRLLDYAERKRLDTRRELSTPTIPVPSSAALIGSGTLVDWLYLDTVKVLSAP